MFEAKKKKNIFRSQIFFSFSFAIKTLFARYYYFKYSIKMKNISSVKIQVSAIKIFHKRTLSSACINFTCKKDNVIRANKNQGLWLKENNELKLKKKY